MNISKTSSIQKYRQSQFYLPQRCLSCSLILLNHEKGRCWRCAGHHAIYGAEGGGHA